MTFNSIELPHVLKVEVTDAADIDTRGQNEGLPWREFKGHKGRQVKASGWVDQLSDLDVLKALLDGTLYALFLPTGDSIPARLTTLKPDLTAENPDIFPYDADFQEADSSDVP